MAANKPRPFTKQEERIGSVAIRLMSAANTWVFRATGGRLGGKFRGGAPVLLLTTTGRKTGQPRTSPLLYLRSGNDYVIVGSKGGMSHNPLWVGNLDAHPDAEIEVGTEKMKVRARRASDAEKARVWPALVKMYPDYDTYQARTERNIPVIFLSPA
jgi:deazaflavin-dependent oxidoreductase (nitroreductase family)